MTRPTHAQIQPTQTQQQHEEKNDLRILALTLLATVTLFAIAFGIQLGGHKLLYLSVPTAALLGVLARLQTNASRRRNQEVQHLREKAAADLATTYGLQVIDPSEIPTEIGTRSTITATREGTYHQVEVEWPSLNAPLLAFEVRSELPNGSTR